MIYFQTDRGVLHQGHVIEVLNELPAESVHCVITSPPYWGLRDYNIEGQVWDADPDCVHVWGEEAHIKRSGGTENSTLGEASGGHAISSEHQKLSITKSFMEASQGQFCQKCNAWRGSLGLEPTIELYLSHLVQVFREVKRVLHKSGCIWVNMGDSYAHNRFTTKMDGTFEGTDSLYSRKFHYMDGCHSRGPKRIGGNLKEKDLCGIPWRVALALQADGWYLRSAMPWVKRAAMPESATDRPASALEYMFLLSKSQHYFFDMDAVRQEGEGYGRGTDPTGKMYNRLGIDAKHESGSKGHSYQGGRNYRNTDLFYESIKPPHGMIFCGDEPVGLDVNPQAFTGWLQTSHLAHVELDAVSDGTQHIVSPYCPYHEGLFAQVSNDFCGGYVSGWLTHILYTCSYLVLKQEGDFSPTHPTLGEGSFSQNLDSLLAECFPSATDHNKEIHKKALDLLTNPSCSSFDKIVSRIADKSEKFLFFVLQMSIHGNNTWLDGSDARLLDQIPYRTVDKSSLPVPPDCLCEYYQIITQESSHFATFPEKLVEPCLKAGTSLKGCCPECLAPWVRVVEKISDTRTRPGTGLGQDSLEGRKGRAGEIESKTIGWKPTCKCIDQSNEITKLGKVFPKPVPCTVMDIFAGSGTVAVVAEKHRRNWILVELSSDYCELAKDRIQQATKQRRLF